MYYLAALLSTKQNPTSELNSILDIYDKLNIAIIAATSAAASAN